MALARTNVTHSHYFPLNRWTGQIFLQLFGIIKPSRISKDLIQRTKPSAWLALSNFQFDYWAMNVNHFLLAKCSYYGDTSLASY